MSVGHALLAFTIAAGLLAITPGIDTALVLRTPTVEGKRRAMLAGMGICSGVSAWGLATSIGLSVLLTISRFAFNALRIAGAGYLLYLGVRLLVGKRIVPVKGIHVSTQSKRERGPNWFMRGFLTNILNSKVGVFYVSFLPQFIPAGVRVLPFGMLLTFIHATESTLWFLMLSHATQLLSRWLRRPSRLLKNYS